MCTAAKLYCLRPIPVQVNAIGNMDATSFTTNPAEKENWTFPSSTFCPGRPDSPGSP